MTFNFNTANHDIEFSNVFFLTTTPKIKNPNGRVEKLFWRDFYPAKTMLPRIL